MNETKELFIHRGGCSLFHFNSKRKTFVNVILYILTQHPSQHLHVFLLVAWSCKSFSTNNFLIQSTINY